MSEVAKILHFSANFGEVVSSRVSVTFFVRTDADALAREAASMYNTIVACRQVWQLACAGFMYVVRSSR